MADAEREGPPVVEYEAPRRRDRSQFVGGRVLGLVAAIVLVAGCAFGGTAIDAHFNRGHLAGLGGLVFGGAAGIALVLLGAIIALLLARRRGSAMLRGVGQGLLIALGLGGLWLGVCAVL